MLTNEHSKNLVPPMPNPAEGGMPPTTECPHATNAEAVSMAPQKCLPGEWLADVKPRWTCMGCGRLVNREARHVVATVEHWYTIVTTRTSRRRFHLSCFVFFRERCAKPWDPSEGLRHFRLLAAEAVTPAKDPLADAGAPASSNRQSPGGEKANATGGPEEASHGEAPTAAAPGWACLRCRRLINPKGRNVVATVEHLYPDGARRTRRRRFHPACFRLFRFLGDDPWDPAVRRVQYRLLAEEVVTPVRGAPSDGSMLAEAR